MAGEWQGRFEFEAFGLEMMCGIHVRELAATTLSPLVVAERLRDHFWSNMRQLSANSLDLLQIVIGTELDGATLAVNESGTASGTSTAAQVAMLIDKVTSQRNGRFFWPQPTELAVGGDGRIGNIAPLQAIVDQAYADCLANEIEWAVPLTTGGVQVGLSQVTGFQVKAVTGTIRGRLRN